MLRIKSGFPTPRKHPGDLSEPLGRRYAADKKAYVPRVQGSGFLLFGTEALCCPGESRTRPFRHGAGNGFGLPMRCCRWRLGRDVLHRSGEVRMAEFCFLKQKVRGSIPALKDYSAEQAAAQESDRQTLFRVRQEKTCRLRDSLAAFSKPPAARFPRVHRLFEMHPYPAFLHQNKADPSHRCALTGKLLLLQSVLL